MRLPGWLLRQEVTVHAYLGEGVNGPVYAAAVRTAAFVDDGHRLVRGAEGDVVTATTTVFLPADVHVTPESRVEVAGRTATAVRVARRTGDGLPVPAHIEVTLS